MALEFDLSFIRVVEVLPPVLDPSEKNDDIPFERKVAKFIDDVRRIKDCADIVLVAGLRSPGRVALSTTSAALLLQSQAGVKGAPVISARDANRREVSSSILGALSSGLESVMLVWGDRAGGEVPKEVYDFSGLSEMILEANKISSAAKTKCRILAPVNLDRLSTGLGLRLAASRVRAGADLLLAQPPTTDPDGALQEHLGLLDSAGLRDRVLLSVFPFRNSEDVAKIQARFGWRLPTSLKKRSMSEGYDPMGDCRAVVRLLRAEGLPGVYLSTRGSPEVAKMILG